MSKNTTIEIDLDDEERDRVLELAVQNILSEPSQEVFESYRDAGLIFEAVGRAVLNEIILKSIQEHIQDVEKDDGIDMRKIPHEYVDAYLEREKDFVKEASDNFWALDSQDEGKEEARQILLAMRREFYRKWLSDFANGSIP